MDVKFDASAAEELMRQMSRYCRGIQQETKSLLEVTKDTRQWNDNQAQAFQNNMIELAKDLNQALSLESEYLRTFQERVRELRG